MKDTTIEKPRKQGESRAEKRAKESVFLFVGTSDRHLKGDTHEKIYRISNYTRHLRNVAIIWVGN
jgi:hypothetical protein